MSVLIQMIYAPAQPFVGQPVRAWLVAAVFALLLAVSLVRARRLKVHPQLLLLVTTAAWLLFGIHELNVPFGAIRIDIVFGWPPLLVLSLGTLLAGIPRRARDRQSQEPKSIRPGTPANPAGPGTSQE